MPGHDPKDAGRRGVLMRPSLLTADEFDGLVETHGPNYACWEYARGWLDLYREQHPLDPGEDYVLLTEVFVQAHSCGEVP